MIKNHLTIVVRLLWNNKVFSIINLLGLTLGISTFIVIFSYVNYNLDYDGFHINAGSTYRIESKKVIRDYAATDELGTPALLSTRLVDKSPQVQSRSRMFGIDYLNNTLEYTEEGRNSSFEQAGIYAVDKEFLDIFDFKFVSGSNEKLSEPYKIVLTKKAAVKYFTEFEQAIGKVVTVKSNAGNQIYEVVGILEDLPQNTHFDFDVLISFSSLQKYLGKNYESWSNPNFMAYIALEASANANEVAALANQLLIENTGDTYASQGIQFDYNLLPLNKIHTAHRGYEDFKPHVRSNIIITLLISAFVVLIIAWINYLNLSIVKTIDRFKEIGVRKYLGSSLSQLASLFLVEALVIFILAIAFCVLSIDILNPYLIEITGVNILEIASSQLIPLTIGIIAIGMMIIGSYPILLVKSISVSSILSKQADKTVGTRARKGMVLVQFIITVVIISGTLAVYEQVNYMREADLGIDVENVLMVQAPPSEIGATKKETEEKFTLMTSELLKYPEIVDVANAGEVPGSTIGWKTEVFLKGKSEENKVNTKLLSMSTNFPEFFELEVIAGRGLRKGDNPWTKGDVVINEALANILGFKNAQDAIGAEIAGFYAPLQVRGVLENHHQTSLHNDFSPIAYIISGWTRYYFYKIRVDENAGDKNSDQIQSIIADVRSEWDQAFPNYPMEYSFVDQEFDKQYKEDARFGKMFMGFSALSILIASLGLFGLTTLTMQKRTKEIGIRKVLGAGKFGLIQILTKEYILLVTIAALVGLPTSWLIVNRWLDTFTFRIELGTIFFAVPLILILLIAILSVIGRIIQVVRENPVNSLRYE